MKFTNNPDKKKNVYDSVGRAGGENAGMRKTIPADAEVPKVPTTQAAAQQQSAPAQAQQPQTQSPIQVDDIVDRIMNRENFSFDLNEDAIYQQYADQYARMGQLAMMDTMGQAQAMTGGYGNSYAQTVGQQSYQNYMQGLNEAIPDLYQMALDRYMMEGDVLMDQYGVLADREAVAEEQRRYDQEWAVAHPELVSGSGGSGGGSGGSGGNQGTNQRYSELDAMHLLASANDAKSAEEEAMRLIESGLDEDVVWKWYGRYYDSDTRNKESRSPSASGGAKKNINRVAY